MDVETVIRVGQEAMLLALLLSGPAVLAALVIGLIISLFQAATQLQEQTLAVVPKIVVVFFVLMATGLWALRLLVEFAVLLFDNIATIAR
ncbi:MAG: flagellar biosynthesis protein FliQ [Planctomycetota bacterium]